MAAARRQPLLFSSPSLVITVRPSRWLALLLLLAHGAVLSVVVLLPVTPWLKAILLASLLLSLFVQFRRIADSRRIEELTLHADGTLEVRRAHGMPSRMQVSHATTVMPWITTLLLCDPQASGRMRRRHEVLVLLPDALEEDANRHLRVWLRWCAISTP